MKAYWINVADKSITEVEYAGLPDMHRMVGGYIEAAKIWPTGDVLYVDEDGLSKQTADTAWFRIKGNDQPMCSGGLVVGPEIGMTPKTYPPKITLDQLRAEVSFLTPEQVAAWARANSSEPMVTIHFRGEEPKVVARTGELFGQAPKPGEKS